MEGLAFELFMHASNCPTRKSSQFILPPAVNEVSFSLRPQQHRVLSGFRKFANLMNRKWKHWIAVSLVTREVFSCASYFRSVFMSRNRMYLLAQTSRDLYSRKMKKSSSSLAPKITRSSEAEAGKGFLFVPGSLGSALALIWLEQDGGWGELSGASFGSQPFGQVEVTSSSLPSRTSFPLPRKSSHRPFGASFCLVLNCPLVWPLTAFVL